MILGGPSLGTLPNDGSAADDTPLVGAKQAICDTTHVRIPARAPAEPAIIREFSDDAKLIVSAPLGDVAGV